MSAVLDSLKALAAGVLTNEPALVVGVIVAVVVAGLTLLPITVPLTLVTTVVTVIVGAIATRLKVTPASQVVVRAPLPKP